MIASSQSEGSEENVFERKRLTGCSLLLIIRYIQHKTKCGKDTKINYSNILITTYGHGKKLEGHKPSQLNSSNRPCIIMGTPGGLANGCASGAEIALESYGQVNAEHTERFPSIWMYSFVFPALTHLTCNWWNYIPTQFSSFQFRFSTIIYYADNKCTYHLFYVYYAPGIGLSASDIHIFHLLLTITLWVGYHHPTDEDLVLKANLGDLILELCTLHHAWIFPHVQLASSSSGEPPSSMLSLPCTELQLPTTCFHT